MTEEKDDAALPAPTRTTVEGKPATRGYLYRFDRWGGDYWRTMHAATFLYPEEPSETDKTRMLTFLRLVPFLLPCSACGLHFAQYIQSRETGLTDAVLASRDTLSRWLVEAHNDVNRRVGKPTVHYDRVRHFYTKDATCPLRKSDIEVDEVLPYRIAVVVLSVMLAAAVAAGFVALRTAPGRRAWGQRG